MGGGKEIVIEPDELQILLNLYGDDFTLSYSLYQHFDILKATFGKNGYGLELLSDKDNYRNKADNFGKHSGEMPSYYDLRDCLLSSGVISHENLKELEKYVNRKVESGVKKVFFCPDTNLLYHNFLSTFDKINPRNIAIQDTVKEEVRNKLNSKYEQTELKLIKQNVDVHENLLNELNNRRKKDSRKASYLAMREYERFSGKTITAERESTNDSEENDKIIAESLREYEKNNPVRIVLLTSDNSMKTVCRNMDLDHFYLRQPHDFTADTCTYREFLKLIRNLSLVYGIIKLNSTIIYGEYGGKNKRDALKLKILDKKLYKKFKKHSQICRNLTKLDIEK